MYGSLIFQLIDNVTCSGNIDGNFPVSYFAICVNNMFLIHCYDVTHKERKDQEKKIKDKTKPRLRLTTTTRAPTTTSTTLQQKQ